MVGQVWTRRPIFLLFALAGLALGSRAIQAGDVLRLTQNIPGDAKPITIHANEIVTWTEGGRRVVLFKGTVLVEHGVALARMKQGVAWVDQEQTRRTGIMHLELYGDGEVSMENGTENRKASNAYLDFNTRGELRLKCYRGRVALDPRPYDPFYQQAQAYHAAQEPGRTATEVQRTSNSELNRGQATGGPRGMNSLPVLGNPASLGRPSGPPTPVNPPAGQEQLPPRSAVDEVQPFSGTIRAAYFDPEAAAESAPPSPPPTTVVTGVSAVAAAPSSGVRQAALEQSPEGAVPSRPPQVPMSPGQTFPGQGQNSPFPGPGPPAPPANPQQPRAPGPTSPAPATPPVPGTRSIGQGPPRQLRVVSRNGNPLQFDTVDQPNGQQAIVVTGGVILTVRTAGPAPGGLVDIEADKVVIWTKGNLQQLFDGIRGPNGQTTREVEFFLSGNVEIREQTGLESRTLRADEVYYDVSRSVAIAYQADLELKQPKLPEPFHMQAQELFQLSPTLFEVNHAEIFASKLPSDPGLTVQVQHGTLEEIKIPKRSLFGPVINRQTGQPETEDQRIFKGDNVLFNLEHVPVFYWPYVQGDANDPLGPLQNVRVGYNRIYGGIFGITWDVYDLLGVDPYPGTRWRLFTDYLTERGPALGTLFDYGGNELFGIPGKNAGNLRLYGIHDTGTDILGGGRGPGDNHPEWRGRELWRHYWELPDDFTVYAQSALISDKNFLEQYFKDEWDRDINQETFLFVKKQDENLAFTMLAKPHLRPWITETEWLPLGSGYLLGQSFFDLFTYNVRGSAGYAQLLPTTVAPFPVDSTDVRTNTGRFDLWQELSLPLSAGPFKIVPYGILDLTYYTRDLTGQDDGRLYGAGGVRGSFPLTRLYPDVQSDLWNLNAINHKIVTSLNYYVAHTETPFSQLPQLDRLNDDATDQALRDITPEQPLINPTYGNLLATSQLYDPQVYAIRRLVDSRVDTLDSIEVLQADIRQRWQTKRGYPGMQHTVDWMVLDLSGSYFPHSQRDNFGAPFAFLQYDYVWNVGDRTALVSTGWIDPIDEPNAQGVRVWTIGAYFNRPDRTNFYLGYRQIDLLNSNVTSASVTYIFSPKYAMTGSTSYDFGTKQALSNSLVFTRVGKDLQMSIGITYNAILNTFGFTFEVVPSLASNTSRLAGGQGFNSGPFGR